jgi:malonyl-CoA O-methyltransferase
MLVKDRIRNSFNGGAVTYEAAAAVQRMVADGLMRKLSQQQSTLLPNSILEIGCGTGILSELVAAQFPVAQYVLTDIAPEMIAQCQQRFLASPHIQLYCMDGEALTLDHTFDLIVSSMTLHWFADIGASFAKIIRQLDAGGQFIFAMLGESSLWQWREVCQQLQLPIATPLFPSAAVMQECFPTMEVEVVHYQHVYTSAYAFLTSLKELGAVATRADYYPVSAGELRRVLRSYKQDIAINYEIIYGCIKG